jgi:hypothetical protein
MKQKDKSHNQAMLVSIIIGAGALMVLGPLREYLWPTPEQEFAHRLGLLLALGCAYAAGCLVTRLVDSAFAAVFEEAPFCEVGNREDKEGYQPWTDAILGALAYGMFLARSVVVIAAVLGLGWCFAKVMEAGL